MNKAQMIFESVKDTAERIRDLHKQLPKGKQHNAFHKRYTRMPTHWKKQRAQIMAQISFTAVSGALQLGMIMQQPIPKFKPGSNHHPGGPVIIQ